VYIALPLFKILSETARSCLLLVVLRYRFGVLSLLEFYKPCDLCDIIERTASIFETSITNEAANEIARRARGTPRIANRLLKRVRDIAQVRGEKEISLDTTMDALKMLQVDDVGLDHIDHKLMYEIINSFRGG